jgi:hypothetical protein
LPDQPETAKAIGPEGITGTGTGPNTGGATGTTVTGPRIAAARAKVKEAETALASAKKEADEAETAEKPKDEKPKTDIKDEAGSKDKVGSKDGCYPPADEKGKKDAGAGEKKPYPPEEEDEDTKKLLEICDALELKGKLPPALAEWQRTHRKKGAEEDEKRMRKMEADIAAIAKAVDGLVTLQKAESSTDDLVGKVASKVVETLQAKSPVIKKSASAPGAINPDGNATATALPTTLAGYKDIPWSKLHEANDERARALATGGP